MNLELLIAPHIVDAINQLYGQSVSLDTLNFQKTRKEFAGDITLVTFPLLKISKKNPEQTGLEIGEAVKKNLDLVSGFNVVKGFLNIELSETVWIDFFDKNASDPSYGLVDPSVSSKSVMVEYSSPNTNKPLHLGHIRNCLLGYAVSEINKAAGRKVYKVQIINDRGIHICKSMLAWQLFGDGETPESTGVKGDHLVGKYYVLFDKKYREEIAELVSKGVPEDQAQKDAPLLFSAQEMLLKWEEGDSEVVSLWKTMNDWVYSGFNQTYDRLGVDFDQNYYESETYKLGKEMVEEGLSKGVFQKRDDGSVWCDLSSEGLDEKLLLRSDGTAVYMTQDLGTAVQRFKDYRIDELIYTVGNEQDYHFKVLFLILEKLGYDWAKNLHHLSYGMVDLPHGKMKSREGTVVDADDLMAGMDQSAKEISEELGKLEEMSQEDKTRLYHEIGMGALKYFILKVDPKKRMMFDPEESIDFNGHTGPFIQYAHARIQSLVRRAEKAHFEKVEIENLTPSEHDILKLLAEYPGVIQQAADELSPAVIANYTYELVKAFNSFYQKESIFNAPTENQVGFRVQLSKFVGHVVKSSMRTLGIEVPNQM